MESDCNREWGNVCYGVCVAMEISREAIRNVQIVFEYYLNNLWEEL